MSDSKNFDDFLKDSFSDYTPDVPPHIWENIAAGRKKKRPAGFWLKKRTALLTVAVLLLLSGAVYWAVDQNNNSKNIAHENGSGQGTGESVPAAVLQDKNENENSSTTKSTRGNKEIEAVQNDKTTIKGVKPAADKPLPNTTVSYTSIEPAGNKDSKDVEPFLTAGRKNKTSLVKKRSVAKTISNAGPSEADKTDYAENGDTGSAIAQDELNILYLDGSRDIIMLSKENNLLKQTIQPVTTPIKISEECPGAAGIKYYLEAYISPDYAIKKYNDTGSSTLVERRKESLRFHSAFSAGLRYTRVFSNGMSIRTGFNYSQINEKFSYAQDNVVQIIYVINNQGDTTDSYYVRGTRYKNSYNHYRTIDVPLVIGYEMGNGNFHANINAGAVINIYSWQTGETLDNNGAPVSITTGKDDNPYQYKTNVGVGFTGAASLYYRLNDRFHVLAEPYFRYNFSPMNKEALSIQEKFTTIGLRLGIRMDIK